MYVCMYVLVANQFQYLHEKFTKSLPSNFGAQVYLVAVHTCIYVRRERYIAYNYTYIIHTHSHDMGVVCHIVYIIDWEIFIVKQYYACSENCNFRMIF